MITFNDKADETARTRASKVRRAKRIKWTTQHLQTVRERYPHEDIDSLARELGVTRKALITVANKILKIRNFVHSSAFRPTAEQILAITERYPNEETRSLAEELGCSVETIKKYAYQHGIHKSKAFMRAVYTDKSKRPGRKKKINLNVETRREISTGTVLVTDRARVHISKFSMLETKR